MRGDQYLRTFNNSVRQSERAHRTGHAHLVVHSTSHAVPSVSPAPDAAERLPAADRFAIAVVVTARPRVARPLHRLAYTSRHDPPVRTCPAHLTSADRG